MAEPTVRRRGAPPGAWTPVFILATLVVAPVGLALTIEHSTYDSWGGFVWGPITLGACIPLVRWAASRSGEPDVAPFLLGAAVLKVIVGAIVRYGSAEAFYGGLADGARYDRVGAELARPFRSGNFTNLGKISGTRFTEVLSGLVQAVIGDTRMGNLFVFSFFGFVGMILMYVAFCEGVPGGDRRLYRLLLFLSPTVWYWPSSIGKEAFMLLCIGAASLGVVRAFAGRLSGFVLGGLGLWGMTVLRPHFTMAFLLGVAFALPALAGRERQGRRPLIAWLAPVAVVAVLPFTLGAVEEFFGIDELNADTAEATAAEVTRRSEQGGSAYEAVDPFTPAGFVFGMVTVLLRPFPWEVEGIQGLVTSAEILLLAALTSVGLWRRRHGLVHALRGRLPRLALGFTLAFTTAFAAIGNFGILARQRSLMFPLAFVLVAAGGRATGAASATSEEREPDVDEADVDVDVDVDVDEAGHGHGGGHPVPATGAQAS